MLNPLRRRCPRATTPIPRSFAMNWSVSIASRGYVLDARTRFRILAITFCVKLPAKASLLHGTRTKTCALFTTCAATGARAWSRVQKENFQDAYSVDITGGPMLWMDD